MAIRRSARVFAARAAQLDVTARLEHVPGDKVFLVKLVFRFSSGIFFGFGRGCAGRVCFIGFGVCRT